MLVGLGGGWGGGWGGGGNDLFLFFREIKGVKLKRNEMSGYLFISFFTVFGEI